MKRMRTKNCCNLELDIANALSEAGISFFHETQRPEQTLDFYLPDYDVYIEIKKFSSERSGRQLQSQPNVILVQGKASVEFITKILKVHCQN